MSVSFIGIALQPADAAAQNGPGPITVDVSGLGSQSGDLMIAIMEYRANSSTWTISNTGGQTWTQYSNISSTVSANITLAWCRFNGSWSANPTFTISTGVLAMSTYILCFRSSTASDLWGLDVAQAGQSNAGPGGAPHTCTVTGITTINANNVALAIFLASVSTVTWNTLTGTGWSTPNASIENTGTTGLSTTFDYNIQATGGATGNVSNNQATTNNTWMQATIAFYAFADPSLSALFPPFPGNPLLI